MTYQSPVQKAKSIRKEIKAQLGLNSRQVSVTGRTVGYSASIVVRVKGAYPIGPIREIAQSVRSVRYDHSGSGDILSGGNTFVSCYYDYEFLDTIKYGEEISAAVSEAAANRNTVVNVGGVKFQQNEYGTWRLDGKIFEGWIGEDAIRQNLATRMIANAAVC